VSDGKVVWSGSGAAWVFADFRFRDRLRERLGSGADGRHCVRRRWSNIASRRSERFASSGGHLPNAGADPQTADRRGSEGWLHPGASRASIATFTLTIEHGQWTQSFNYDRIREGVGFEATYKVIDHSTVLVTEPRGYETVFEYALEGNAIRISFKNADPQQLCQADAKCPMGVIVWQSGPFSRV
jgi:hypothetical protein